MVRSCSFFVCLLLSEANWLAIVCKRRSGRRTAILRQGRFLCGVDLWVNQESIQVQSAQREIDGGVHIACSLRLGCQEALKMDHQDLRSSRQQSQKSQSILRK